MRIASAFFAIAIRIAATLTKHSARPRACVELHTVHACKNKTHTPCFSGLTCCCITTLPHKLEEKQLQYLSLAPRVPG